MATGMRLELPPHMATKASTQFTSARQPWRLDYNRHSCCFSAREPAPDWSMAQWSHGEKWPGGQEHSRKCLGARTGTRCAPCHWEHTVTAAYANSIFSLSGWDIREEESYRRRTKEGAPETLAAWFILASRGRLKNQNNSKLGSRGTLQKRYQTEETKTRDTVSPAYYSLQ
ncbi:hypothetical protein Y1Q_0015815 [Alligator mississippiensis]|nr:hypothetical protein Y1Q_0015815 [Alligator mississippiensis]